MISAVGFLNVPSYPDWPGLDDFGGPHFHTSRWEHHHDLSDKVVAVVGSGSTATQVVPAIQPIVKKLYVFQREPGWVTPKFERDLTDEERALFAKPWRRVVDRSRLRWLIERSLWGGAMFRPGTKLHGQRQQACLDYIANQFADRPDLREGVTPKYPFPGKRPIIASTYYPALKKDNVELVPRAVSRVTGSGIVDAEGVERSVDAIVMATGFQAANYLARLRVVGRTGETLQDRWAGEPRAYLGITVPGFPNFFMLYGPGTNGGELVSMLEAQAEYAVRALRRMQREGLSAIEVRPSFEALWYAWLQSKMRGTSWTMSSNYFKSETGKVVTQWPSGNLVYRALTKLSGRVSETSLAAPPPFVPRPTTTTALSVRTPWPAARRDPSVQCEEVARALAPAEEPGMSMTVDIDPLDLVDPARFARDGYPHHVWTRLRAEAPVAYIQPPGHTPFWAITKHADIVEAASQPLIFSSAQGITLDQDIGGIAAASRDDRLPRPATARPDAPAGQPEVQPKSGPSQE